MNSKQDTEEIPKQQEEIPKQQEETDNEPIPKQIGKRDRTQDVNEGQSSKKIIGKKKSLVSFIDEQIERTNFFATMTNFINENYPLRESEIITCTSNYLILHSTNVDDEKLFVVCSKDLFYLLIALDYLLNSSNITHERIRIFTKNDKIPSIDYLSRLKKMIIDKGFAEKQVEITPLKIN